MKFLEKNVASALGVNPDISIQFIITFTDLYLSAQSVPKIEVKQPGNEAFGLSFQLYFQKRLFSEFSLVLKYVRILWKEIGEMQKNLNCHNL